MLKKYGLLIVGISGLSGPVQANKMAWTVAPTICVAATSGSTCKMDVAIYIQSLPAGSYCIYESQNLLQCKVQEDQHLTFSIAIDEETMLTLKNENGQDLLKQHLAVKSRQQRSRRRVRQPWSLF